MPNSSSEQSIPQESSPLIRDSARKNPSALGRLHDAATHDLECRQMRDVFAVEHDAPGRRMRVSANRHEQGRLAGAVRADQRYDLAAAYDQVDTAQRGNVAVVRLDVFEREQIVHCRSRCAPTLTLPRLRETVRVEESWAARLRLFSFIDFTQIRLDHRRVVTNRLGHAFGDLAT